MEDRYLFKAKRIDNGEWVKGLPFEIEGKHVILIKDNENLLRVHYLEENMWTAEIYAIEVDTSTICQCTGLKDKNGNMVWENDIVKYDWGGTRIDFIEYQPPIFTYSKSMRWNLQQDEVIGNIFDNPELLESEG